jgi:hypothetical protein
MASRALWVLAVVAASAAPLCADDCFISSNTVDLSCTFVDPPERNQGGVGSCHAFASVAALESAAYRAYGTKVSLSEADLFVSAHLSDGSYFSPTNRKLDLALGRPSQASGPLDGYVDRVRLAEGLKTDQPDDLVEEGGDVWADLTYAIDNGVASGDLVPYYYFYSSYAGGYPVQVTPPLKPDLVARSKLAIANALTLANIRDFSQLEPPVSVPYVAGPESGDSSPRDLRQLKLILLADGDPRLMGEIDNNRELNRRGLSGFKIEATSWDKGSIPTKADHGPDRLARCGEESVYRRDWVVGQLRLGHPVILSADLQGYEAWYLANVDQPAYHAFVLTGYRTDGSGAKVFSVRNSWAGRNPDVRESELCRARAAYVVTTPADADWLRKLGAKPGPP